MWWIVASRQKLGISLENEGFYVNNKKCVSKKMICNEKKYEKIRIIFYIENWLWVFIFW